MSSTGHITRALWRKRGWTWLFDRPRPCRNFTIIHKPSLHCASPRSHSSSAATAQIVSTEHVPIRRCRHSRTKPNDPLKERLSSLHVETATQQQLDEIWKLFLQREQLSSMFPPLVTMLFRLVAKKGTIDMMDTLHKRFAHRDLHVEDIEWIIFANIRAGKIKDAHRLLNDMYRVGQTPTLATYNHLIKFHAKHFYNKRRREIAQNLLDEMCRKGVQPGARIYMQLMLGEAIHGSDRDAVQVWLDRMMELEATKGYRRTQHRLKKLIQVLSSKGHPALYTVLRTGTNVGLEFDIDTWNAAIAGYARAGNTGGAYQILSLVRQRNIQTIDTYHALIQGHLARPPLDMEAAIQAFQTMLQDGIVANQSTYNIFLLAYTKHDIEDDDLQIKTLRQLFRASASSSKQGVPDGVLERLFDFYIQRGVISEAEQLYWDMRQRGHPLSRRIQSRVFKTITEFARRRQMLSAFSLVYDLLANDYWPSSQVVCSIIKACGARRDLDAAKQMLNIMEDISRDKVRQVCYDTLACEYKIAARREAEEEQMKIDHVQSREIP
ncbi:hypothetical protein BJV82DRAFT_636946 [Fennellomyces sp. T-0311]|nr:hypothetical protein BJV82DRAFT_636946 [Fennellomyces sp. T-0311]